MEAQSKNYELKIPFAVSKTPVERKKREKEVPFTAVNDSQLLNDAGTAFDSARFGNNESELAASAYRYRMILKNHIAKSALHTGVNHDI